MTYIVSLWKEDFLIALLWSIDCRGRRPAKYRAPSFSWASLDISVNWGRNLYPAFEMYGHPQIGLWIRPTEMRGGWIASLNHYSRVTHTDLYVKEASN